MITSQVWTILGIIAFISLILFWKRANAIWAGWTIGIIVGFIIAIIRVFKGSGLEWSIPLKGAIMGVLAGVAAELLGRAANLIFKKK